MLPPEEPSSTDHATAVLLVPCETAKDCVVPATTLAVSGVTVRSSPRWLSPPQAAASESRKNAPMRTARVALTHGLAGGWRSCGTDFVRDARRCHMVLPPDRVGGPHSRACATRARRRAIG